MTKIVHKNLPNAVSVSDVTDATVRQKLMLSNQNIAVLMSQLAEAQKAIVELQRRTGMSVTLGGSTAEVKTVVNATLQEKGIQDGAEPNVQSDWAQTDTTADDYIKNKPEIPQPTSQVNSDWNATSGVAKILNKPTTMKNPYALSLTPINAAGSTGSVVQYDGSVAKSLSVVTAHQDVSGKMNTPSGGSVGQVLTKTSGGYGWQTIGVGDTIGYQNFSVTSGSMSATSNTTITQSVAKTGYTPILVGNVACKGNNTSVYESFRACVCVKCSISGNNVVIEISLAAPPGAITQTANVTFTVLYVKN